MMPLGFGRFALGGALLALTYFSKVGECVYAGGVAVAPLYAQSVSPYLADADRFDCFGDLGVRGHVHLSEETGFSFASGAGAGLP